MAVVLLFDGVLLGLLAWAYHSPRFVAHRISPQPSMKVPKAERLRNIAVSSVLSLVFVFGLPYLMYQRAFHPGAASTGRIVFEIFAILLVYDFAYYWLHRAMHHKKVMRLVHGVHHRVHNPTAMESFYLHPIELFAGLALLMACTWLVGPVDVVAYTAVFFLHSSLNIIVHSGLISGFRLLAPLDDLTRKHHVHHMDNYDANYASLTPLPDLLFGTYR